MAKKPGIIISNLNTDWKRLKRHLPIRLGERVLRFFELSFKKEGFTDASFEPWAKRKKETPQTTGKPVLVSESHLRDSLEVKQSNFKRTVIATEGIPYANRHNFGKNGMTKRQFIGDSKILDKGVEKLIADEINKSLIK